MNICNRNIVQGGGEIMNVFPVERSYEIPAEFGKFYG